MLTEDAYLEEPWITATLATMTALRSMEYCPFKVLVFATERDPWTIPRWKR